jgi:hypothetical protein
MERREPQIDTITTEIRQKQCNEFRDKKIKFGLLFFIKHSHIEPQTGDNLVLSLHDQISVQGTKEKKIHLKIYCIIIIPSYFAYFTVTKFQNLAVRAIIVLSLLLDLRESVYRAVSLRGFRVVISVKLKASSYECEG